MKTSLAFQSVLGICLGFSPLKGVALGQTVLSTSFEGVDISSQTLDYTVCSHAQFKDVKANASTFRFSRTMRFCNFDRVEAIAAQFDAFFYNQHFVASDLRGAKFHLRLGPDGGSLPSQVTFKDSNLEGVSFFGDVTNLSFVNSRLGGVKVNGLPCELVLKECGVADAGMPE